MTRTERRYSIEHWLKRAKALAQLLTLAEDQSQAEYLHNASIIEENAKMQQELHELQEKTAAANKRTRARSRKS